MDTNILAALIALFGTVITVSVGYRQWKHQQATNYPLEFQKKRLSAYQKLWNMLPGASFLYTGKYELELTLSSIDENKIRKLSEELRLYCLQNELYIEATDRLLVMQYVEGLLDFIKSSNELEMLDKKLEAISEETNSESSESDMEKTLSEMIKSLETLLALTEFPRTKKTPIKKMRAIGHYRLIQLRIIGSYLTAFDKILSLTQIKPSVMNLTLSSIFFLAFPLLFRSKFSSMFKEVYAKATHVRNSRIQLVKRLRLAMTGKK
jgi:hypothetical protein